LKNKPSSAENISFLVDVEVEYQLSRIKTLLEKTVEFETSSLLHLYHIDEPN